MSEPIRKSITATLQSMLSHSEDTTQSAAAGCLGALFRRLPADELEALVNECLIHDDPSLDWTLRHGRSAVLSVALKEAAEQVYTAEWRDKLHRVLLSYLTTDQIPIELHVRIIPVTASAPSGSFSSNWNPAATAVVRYLSSLH